jgi:hypothetical protein
MAMVMVNRAACWETNCLNPTRREVTVVTQWSLDGQWSVHAMHGWGRVAEPRQHMLTMSACWH